MRPFFICLMLSYCQLLTFAQGIDFLQGVWRSEDGKRTTEFHRSTNEGKPVLIGRSWSGNSQACPWCVAETAMEIYYDGDSRGIRLHMRDRVQGARDFYLVTARKRYIELTDDEGGVMELQSKRPDLLSIRLGQQILIFHRQ